MGIFKDFASEDKELSLALKDFNGFRKKINMPLADEDKEKLLLTLQKFPREQWVAIIRQSIDKQWAGFYPLKEQGKNIKISNDPGKWARSPAFLQAIQDLLEWGNSDGRYHDTV